MVYRKTFVAATVALLAGVALGLEGSARAAASDPLGVVETGGAPEVDWAGVFPIRADLGNGRLLVEMDAEAWRAVKVLGLRTQIVEAQPAPNEILYRVVGATAVERAMMPRLGRVLWTDGEQALVAPVHEEDAWALGGDGVRLYKVFDHPMRPAAPASAHAASFAVADDPAVDDIVSKITASDISGFDSDLVAFGTRHSNQQGGLQAQAYLVSTFQSFGLTQIEQQSVPNIQAKNVCATLPGTTTPDQVLVVGGHYDSITSNPANAPGADDDGSGTSGMLAIAKILSTHHFKSTITFCGFAGEELGLLGSQAYAQELAANGTNVVGMIEMDMIGYLDPGDSMDIDVLSNTSSATMRSLFSDVVTRYEPAASQVDGQIPAGASSDHASFWQEGFPALLLFEDTGNYSPYIHTANDTIGTSFNSPELAEEISRGAGALLATMAGVDDGGTTGTPTPTPQPTGTPGNGATGNETIHGSGCACAVGARAPSAASNLAALLLGLAAAVAVGRRRRA